MLSFAKKTDFTQSAKYAKCLYSLKTQPLKDIDSVTLLGVIIELLHTKHAKEHRQLLIFSTLCFSSPLKDLPTDKLWFYELTKKQTIVRKIFYLFLFMNRYKNISFSVERKEVMRLLNNCITEETLCLSVFNHFDSLRIRRIKFPFDRNKTPYELFKLDEEDLITLPSR